MPTVYFIDMPYPPDDVRLLINAAVDALGRVFRVGFKYSKAEGAIDGEYTSDLFAEFGLDIFVRRDRLEFSVEQVKGIEPS